MVSDKMNDIEDQVCAKFDNLMLNCPPTAIKPKREQVKQEQVKTKLLNNNSYNIIINKNI